MASNSFESGHLSLNRSNSQGHPTTMLEPSTSLRSRSLYSTSNHQHPQQEMGPPSQPMPEWQKAILRVNSPMMKTNIRFEDCMILEHLHAKNVLTEMNMETLQNMHSKPKAQVHKFIRILECSGDKVFYDFIDALKQEVSYTYIWEKLVADENKYYSSLNKADSCYITSVSSKSSEEQLHVDERSNTFIVTASTFVQVIVERRVSQLKSRLWELYRTVMSGGSGNYEEISHLSVTEEPTPQAALPQTNADLKLNVKDFLKDKADSCYITSVSSKSSEEQLHVDERSNTFIVTASTFVQVIVERRVSQLKSRLWELYRTVMSGGSGNYEEISHLSVTEEPTPQAALPQTNADLKLNVKDFLKDFCKSAEVEIEKGQQLLLERDLTDLIVEIFNTGEYGLAYNAHRGLLVVEFSHLKAFGDISEEMWYYPTPVPSRQITEWLTDTKLKGTFYVYKSSNSDPNGPDFAVYNMGLCHNESGDVIHYRILQNRDNELEIGDIGRNRGMKFDSIENLVKYFRTTRGCLECKLRWSPRELAEKPTLDFIIAADQLEFEEIIASHSNRNHTSNVIKGVFAGRNVAIKSPARLPRNKVEEDDFLMEARVLSKLSHENIIKFEGVCFTKDSWNIVLEYADYSDLQKCLQRGHIDCTDVRNTLMLWMQLLDALVYLKSQKYVIQRDIAARNILMPSLQVLKLSDFGMAAKVEQHDEFIPDKGDLFSYRWAAPEVLLHRCYSTASDVWSSGVVYWEIATGGQHLPYRQLKDNSKVEKKVTSGTKLSYSEDMDKDHERPMKEIVSLCWKKDPKQRPTAEDLLQSCSKYLTTLDGGEVLYEYQEPRVKKGSSFRRMKDKVKVKLKSKKT